MVDTVIVYNGQTMDGICAAAIATQQFPNSILMDIDYGKEDTFNVSFLHDKCVIMLGWCASPIVMDEINENAKMFLWIDHHVSSIETMKDIRIRGHRDPSYSTCELTWTFFNSGKTPRIVYLLGRYNLWDKNNPNWGIISNFNTSFKQDNMIDPKNPRWDHLFKSNDSEFADFETIMSNKGCLLTGYLKKMYVYQCEKHGFITEIGDLKALALNTPFRGSEVFESFREEYDLYLSFTFSGTGWIVRAYSFKPDVVNVSEVFKDFKGIGCSSMVEFLCQDLPFRKSE
jgi:hypothetical protein